MAKKQNKKTCVVPHKTFIETCKAHFFSLNLDTETKIYEGVSKQ